MASSPGNQPKIVTKNENIRIEEEKIYTQREREREIGMEIMTHSASLQQDPPTHPAPPPKASTRKAGGWKAIKYIIGNVPNLAFTCIHYYHFCMFLKRFKMDFFFFFFGCFDYVLMLFME